MSWVNWPFSAPERLLAQLLASKRSSRRNSNRLPWNSLLPDLVMALTTPPATLPNSAE